MQNKTTFTLVQIGTIIAILCFAYFFHASFYGTASAADSGVPINDTRQVPPGPRGYAKPVNLSIPSIGVNAKVQKVGVTAKGAMGIPTNFVDVGWYMNGTIPGEVGSAVIDGHVDNALSLPGVFKNLKNIKVGDRVFVTDEKGAKIEFVVRDIKTYAYDEVPEEEIFHESEKTLLRLITCGGKWIASKKTYDERVIVTAEFLSPDVPLQKV